MPGGERSGVRQGGVGWTGACLMTMLNICITCSRFGDVFIVVSSPADPERRLMTITGRCWCYRDSQRESSSSRFACLVRDHLTAAGEAGPRLFEVHGEPEMLGWH